jgi:hypothetical protein
MPELNESVEGRRINGDSRQSQSQQPASAAAAPPQVVDLIHEWEGLVAKVSEAGFEIESRKARMNEIRGLLIQHPTLREIWASFAPAQATRTRGTRRTAGRASRGQTASRNNGELSDSIQRMIKLIGATPGVEGKPGRDVPILSAANALRAAKGGTGKINKTTAKYQLEQGVKAGMLRRAKVTGPTGAPMLVYSLNK